MGNTPGLREFSEELSLTKKSSSLLGISFKSRVSVNTVEHWAVRKRGFMSIVPVDGTCHTRTDVEG